MYYCQVKDDSQNQEHLKSLQDISENIANQKEFFLKRDWKWWWDEFAKKIAGHKGLNKTMFTTQSDFNQEELNFRYVGRPGARTIQTRLILHKILSDFIFHYQPCMNLLGLVKNQKTPTIEDWQDLSGRWCHLTSDPYQLVCFFLFLSKHHIFSHTKFLSRLLRLQKLRMVLTDQCLVN